MTGPQRPEWDPSAAPTFWINHASRALMRRFDERLRPFGYSMAYVRVAIALEQHGPMQQKELLEHVDVEQPTLTALLTRMERDRLLSRKADPRDARARLVSLTARGASRLAEVKQALAEVVDQALTGIAEQEQQVVLRVLRQVVANLGQEGEP